MISLYNKDETDFSHNGIILSDLLTCEIEEELNGKYILELEHLLDDKGKWKYLQEEVIVKADGQLFRIHNISKNLNSVSVVARHIFYDLLHNFLEDVRPTNIDGIGALNHILSNTQYPHRFSATGNVRTVNTQYYIRKNVVESILSDDSLVTRWRGEIDRDNYRIIFLDRLGQNRGVKIHYGKNLLGLEVNINTDNMITRIMPQGNDELLLPEKYIDSELVSEYAFPYIKKVDFNIGVVEDTEDEKGITKEEAIDLLREEAIKYMEDNKTDIPDVNIKADLLLLENTEEYKNFKQLEKVHLGDTISISKNPLGLEFESRVISVRKNLLTNKNINVEIGDPEGRISDTLNKTIEASNTEIREQINTVQIAANGKNKVFRGEQEPTEGMSKNDLWYKPVGDGEVEMYQYDGDTWVLIVSTGVNMEVSEKIDEAKELAENAKYDTEATIINVNSVLKGLGVDPLGETHQSIVDDIQTSVDDNIANVIDYELGQSVEYQSLIENKNLYERVIGSSEEGIKDNVARMVMTDSIFQTQIVDGINDVSTSLTQLSNKWIMSIESGDDIVTSINASTTGVAIKGKNIILDGNTVVDGTFTVTDEIFAPKMSISKFTVGTLNGANVNIINLNASSIVTGTLDSIDIKGGKITQQRGSNRAVIEDGEIKSYINGDLAMKWGGWKQEFYNTSNDLIGSLEPTRLLNREGLGLALTVNHDFLTIGHMVDGTRYPVFRTEEVGNAKSTYVLGPYDNRLVGNRNSELFLGATSTIALNPNMDMSRVRQASMIFRHNPSAENGNSVTMYVGGWSKYSDQHFEIRANDSGGESSSRIGYISGEATRFQAAYDVESTFTTNLLRVNTIGELQRTSSSRRYKLDEKVVDLDYARKILNIDAKKWIDKATFERENEVVEAGGVIAEDVHDEGLNLYVSYNEKGNPDGISANLWTLLLPVVKNQEKRIAELEQKLEGVV